MKHLPRSSPHLHVVHDETKSFGSTPLPHPLDAAAKKLFFIYFFLICVSSVTGGKSMFYKHLCFFLSIKHIKSQKLNFIIRPQNFNIIAQECIWQSEGIDPKLKL